MGIKPVKPLNNYAQLSSVQERYFFLLNFHSSNHAKLHILKRNFVPGILQDVDFWYKYIIHAKFHFRSEHRMKKMPTTNNLCVWEFT